MTATTVNPLKGKAKADGGGDFKAEVPSVDTHDARVVAMIDLGTQMESFGGEEPKPRRQFFIAYELDEETSVKGVNHVVGVRYTLSFHEKATLRKLAEAILNDGQKFPPDHDVDYGALLGQPCSVQISHKQGTGEKSDRKYVVVGTISAIPKKRRDQVFKPRRAPVLWLVGEDRAKLPDYLPRIYGEKVEDVIGRCRELTGRRGARAAGEGEIDDPETPF